jgi:hypothetical protein
MRRRGRRGGVMSEFERRGWLRKERRGVDEEEE